MTAARQGAMGQTTALAVAIASGVVLVTTASAASFSDPVGDVLVEPPGAMLQGLDIVGVEVANTADAYTVVTLRVTLADAPPALPPNSGVAVLLDTDKNPSTGDEGIDASFIFELTSTGAHRVSVGRYDATTRELLYFGTTGSASYANGAVELSMPRFELNNTRGFTFTAITLVGTPEPRAIALDIAPDGELWTYDLVGLPPLLEAARAYGEPTRPRAGKRFVVTSEVIREDTGERVLRGKVSCSARVGSAPLRGIGGFGGAGARCSMNVPRNARGKTLRGTMTIQAAGATVKRSFTFRVV